MPEKNLLSFTVNLNTALTRFETFEGKEHIVAPMVMITEGVHNGSQGPIFYSTAELENSVPIWNHKPVVVYHPEINGQGVSACDPDILATYKIGYIFHTRVEDGKLKAEAWLDPDRVAEVDDRVGAAIATNTMMELSTGVFTEQEEAEEGAVWNEESYTAIARNLGPDHLAILPDKIGACSIKDGAGLMRNQSESVSQIKDSSVKRTIRQILENELSHGTIQEELSNQLRARFLPAVQDGWVWVNEAFDDFVIYEIEPNGGPTKLFKLSYSKTETAVTLGDEEPVEVVRVIEFRTKDGIFVGSQEKAQTPSLKVNENKGIKMKEIIDALISNAKTHWSEEDRVTLEGLDEGTLNKMGPVEIVEPEPVVVEPVKNDKPQTMDEYIAAAPEGVREVLVLSVNDHKANKARLVKEITDNEKNTLAQDVLENMGIDVLKSIAELAQKEGTTNNDVSFAGNLDGASAGEAPKPLHSHGWDEA